MKLLAGKTAIVTGAARGIGEGIALKFAEEGANVAFTFVSDSSAEKAKALEEKLIAMGVKAKAYQSNAGDFAACEIFVNDVLKEFGQIDICVNNAGISKDNLLLRMTPDHDEGSKRQHYKYEQHHRRDRQCRPKQLCCKQSGRNWVYKKCSQRTGQP